MNSVAASWAQVRQAHLCVRAQVLCAFMGPRIRLPWQLIMAVALQRQMVVLERLEEMLRTGKHAIDIQRNADSQTKSGVAPEEVYQLAELGSQAGPDVPRSNVERDLVRSAQLQTLASIVCFTKAMI